MPTLKYRQALALLSSAMLLTTQLPLLASAQSQGAASSQQSDTRPDPKLAKKALELGEKAEAAGFADEALAEYEEAAKYAPTNTAIVERAAALRSKLVRGHVDAAERNALEGHLQQATIELAAALEIDPGNAIVAERLAQMKSMEIDDEVPTKAASQISDVPKLQPKSGKKDINLRGDTKTVYEQLALLFGVKVNFDPDLPARTARLILEDVDFYTAISILGQETGTFWIPLDGLRFFVAQDTQEKRKAFDIEAEQSFPLPASVASDEMTEIVRVLRDITGSPRVTLDAQSRTITLRDTPQRLALAGELIRQLESARGEVMLDIELLEVNRNKARQLGVVAPSSAQLFTVDPRILQQARSATDLGSLLTLLAGVFGGAAGAGGSLSSLTPHFITVGGGSSTFLLQLPSGAVNFSDALTLVRSGQQVLLRAQDGKPATFFVGDRYPVTLSLLSGSLGAGGVQTPSLGGASLNSLTSTPYPVGIDPVSVLAADFENNNSGFLDLAVLNSIDNTITILQNQGASASTFAVAATSPITVGTPRTVLPSIAPTMASAVLTSSGFHDLLITDPENNEVIVLLNDQKNTGTFLNATGSPIAVGKGPSAIVAGDFNNDGFMDFAVANQIDNTISIFYGSSNQDGTFTLAPGSPFKLPTGSHNPVAMTVADFDANGLPDLAVLTNDPTGTDGNVIMFLNNPAGTFTEPASNGVTVVGKGPVAMATGDLDSNGSADLAVVNQTDGTVTVLLNTGAGTFVAGPNSPLTTGTTPVAITIADANQDGQQDIAVANAGTNTFSLFLGAALNGVGGIFALAVEPAAGPSGTAPTALFAAPLSGGTFPDLVIANQALDSNNSVSTTVKGDVSVFQSPASIFSSSSGVGQTPYPGAEYIDLGVKIKATPSLHANHEVTLQLEFEIRALAGTNSNGIPIISNRTLSQTVRVKEDETTLIGGLTDEQETRSIAGLPGFANLPVIGYAFGTRGTSLEATDLLILITPRRLRDPSHFTHTIYAGRGDRSGSSGGGGAPVAPTDRPRPAPNPSPTP